MMILVGLVLIHTTRVAAQNTPVQTDSVHEFTARDTSIITSDTLQSESEDEIVITGRAPDRNVRSTDMGKVSLSMDQVKKLPLFMGEADPIKAIALMPGVKTSEGNTGLYVRGGGPDQNLVLLDGVPIYNPGHLLGFFSVFNADALKNATLIKGGMPAEYGGRLSSVLDITMKSGDQHTIHGEGGIGLISSRLTLEGPLVKNKGSFVVSGRRTYLDVLIQPFLKGQSKGSRYYFYDLNLKADYQLGRNDYLTLSGYLGKDKMHYKSQGGGLSLDIPWGNKALVLNWQHFFNPDFTVNTSVSYNKYDFQFTGRQENVSVGLYSGIRDYSLNHRYSYKITSGNTLTWGLSAIHHMMTPNQISGNSNDTSGFSNTNPIKKYSLEGAVYIQDNFQLGDKWEFNAGLRASGFALMGPYAAVTRDDNGNVTDSIPYKKGSVVKKYGGLEPRFSGRFQIDENSSLKAGIARNYQYIHMVSNNGSTLPTDNWVPSTLLVGPERAWQYSLGYYRNLHNNMFEGSVEVYYKDLKGQIEYKPGYTPDNLNDPEDNFTFGKGYAYGAEFYLNKKAGKLTGWIGYTLSWTWRKFDALNNGLRFPSKYDRRNDVSLVATYECNKKWTFSGVYVYGTGNALTLPTSYYVVDNRIVMDYSKINAYRAPSYHRLDLSAVFTPGGNKKKRWYSTWAFSVYNVYNHLNPYIIYIKTDGTLQNGTKVSVREVSVFTIIPTITYNFKF